MFGSHDNDEDNQNQDDNSTMPTSQPADNSGVSDDGPGFDTSNISLPSQGDSLESDDSGSGTPMPSGAPSTGPTENSLLSNSTTNDNSDDNSTSDDDDDKDEQVLRPSDKDDLIRIKQDALQQLSPLVDHLDQSPEEKFRTTMMMIQASDDESLLQTAYEAAKSITNDKVRAQALLDVINEINYFTQQPK